MAEQIRVTLVGDIMCEPLLLKSAARNAYDFSNVFKNVTGMFQKSDYVIGNLETPLAGKNAGYVRELFSFNTPDSFADAMVKAGINFVSTANNHCLDRGYEGMCRTLSVLDHKGIAHTGTYLPTEKRTEGAYFEVGGTRIAIVAYTYGTNYSDNKLELTGEQLEEINLLRPQTEFYFEKKAPEKTASKSMLKSLINSMMQEVELLV